jgi:hypothetical protein
MPKDEAEILLDNCWDMLNRKYEEVYGVKNYACNKPSFRWILTYAQRELLRQYAGKLCPNTGFAYQSERGREYLFGHLVIVKETPRLETLNA